MQFQSKSQSQCYSTSRTMNTGSDYMNRPSYRSVMTTSSARKPVHVEGFYAFTVAGGAGGYGTKISKAPSGTRVGSGFGGGYDYQPSGSSSGTVAIANEKITMQGLNDRMAGWGGYDYQSSGTTPETLAIANEKTTMQHLNSRLSSYLETVRKLEKANSSLEIKIREAMEKRGPSEGRDYSRYEAIIAELRAQILDMIKDNAHLATNLDNAHLASDDFRVKMEYESSMRRTVEVDVAGLRTVLDDTNVICMHLETEIESLKEELIGLRKDHETDVAELRAQITQAGVRVDVDAPKGQDLTRIMEEMRAQYEKIALKNQEEAKAWHESQITEVQVQVTESSTALKEATIEMTETKRRYQALEIDLQSALSLKASLEATLHDVEMHYNMELEKYNAIILRLQEELAHIRDDIQHNSIEYENLFNIKVKLEAEIAEYRRLLDGGDLRIEDAVDSKTVQTKVVTLTQTLVDGKVVSESKDVKSSEKVVD